MGSIPPASTIYLFVTVPCKHPGESLSYQLLVGEGTADSDQGNGSTIAVSRHRLNLDGLGEDEDGGNVLSLGPKVLMLLRAVDAVEADFLPSAIVEDGDAVAVNHPDYLAGPGQA